MSDPNSRASCLDIELCMAWKRYHYILHLHFTGLSKCCWMIPLKVYIINNLPIYSSSTLSSFTGSTISSSFAGWFWNRGIVLHIWSNFLQCATNFSFRSSGRNNLKKQYTFLQKKQHSTFKQWQWDIEMGRGHIRCPTVLCKYVCTFTKMTLKLRCKILHVRFCTCVLMTKKQQLIIICHFLNMRS